VPSDLPVANCSDLVIIRPGDLIDSRWLVYFINGASRGYVHSRLVGAVQQHFNVGAAREMILRMPPISEQRAIAEVLGVLDDKIDLLHRQNQTLEALAETLFRQWFIEEADPAWNERPLSDLVEHLKIPVKPSEQPNETFFHYSLPAFDTAKRPVAETGGAILSNKYAVPKDTILVSKLNPRVPRIWPIPSLIPDNSVCSTEFQVIKPSRDLFGYVYYFLKSEDARNTLASSASGTSGSHQRVTPNDILNLTVNVSEDLTKPLLFSGIVKPQLDKIYENQTQIQKLEKIRDALLPKLMSGEVRVYFNGLGGDCIAPPTGQNGTMQSSPTNGGEHV
ncbi:MAG: restriction endonuclease subunit S, partial [Vampirovibrionales bacterium]|nr:restriction endonuclease subunit S [Vampirovibrionales bacterium]